MIKLSNFQVLSLISTSFLPLLFWTFPQLAAQSAGPDALWAVLLACVFGIIASVIQALINQRFPYISGADVPVYSYGKFIGTCLQISIIPIYMMFIALSLTAFSNTLEAFLPNTPKMVLEGCLVFVALIGASYGIETLGRTASFVYPLVTGFAFVIFAYVLSRGHMSNVPLQLVSPLHTLYGSYTVMPLFFGINMIWLLSPFCETRGKGNILRLSILSAVLSSALVILVFLGVLAIFGYETLSRVTDPTAFSLRLIRFSGLVIERAGIIMIIMTTLFEVIFVSNHLWAISVVAVRAFKVNANRYKLFLIPCAVSVSLMNFLLRSPVRRDFILMYILIPLSVLIILVEPAMRLGLAYLRGVSTKSGR